MIKVTMELIPLGVGPSEHLGTATITNIGTGTKTKGNYVVRLSRKGQPESEWKSGHVNNFNRKEQLGWDLLLLALEACIGDRRRGE